jgi:hypothetical protein
MFDEVYLRNLKMGSDSTPLAGGPATKGFPAGEVTSDIIPDSWQYFSSRRGMIGGRLRPVIAG